MQKYARLVASNRIECVDMVRPESNFDFVDSRFPELLTLKRVLSLTRQHGERTIIVERLDPSKDLQEENEDIRRWCKEFSQSTAHRLSFFAKSVANEAQLATTTDRDFIGYVILKDDVIGGKREYRIYEAVIRRPGHRNNFIKRAPVWSVRVGTKVYRIEGHLYAQQNGISNSCAHVAVRTAASCFTGRDMSYREMNRILGIKPPKRSPGEGLELKEMIKLLQAAGGRCFAADYRAKSKITPPSFQKYVYGSIESGYPSIISFQTTRETDKYHGIPIFGHTFNSDTWVPSAEQLYFEIGPDTRYIPSESWVSMYIGHDDNWGPLYCVPRHYFQTQHPIDASNDEDSDGERSVPAGLTQCVAHVISTVPKKVRVSPIRAEAIGIDYLLLLRPRVAKLRKNIWAKRLNFYARRKLLVVRPNLITLDQYCSHLERIRGWKHNRIDARMLEVLRSLAADQVLWMVELSVPELFSANLRKIGEVLIRAQQDIGTRTLRERLSGFFLARLPGYFALLTGIKKQKPRFSFVASGVEGHVELFGCEESG
jgi:hypothetical protein